MTTTPTLWDVGSLACPYLFFSSAKNIVPTGITDKSTGYTMSIRSLGDMAQWRRTARGDVTVS